MRIHARHSAGCSYPFLGYSPACPASLSQQQRQEEEEAGKWSCCSLRRPGQGRPGRVDLFTGLAYRQMGYWWAILQYAGGNSASTWHKLQKRQLLTVKRSVTGTVERRKTPKAKETEREWKKQEEGGDCNNLWLLMRVWTMNRVLNPSAREQHNVLPPAGRGSCLALTF